MKLQTAIKKATKATGSQPNKNGIFYSFEFNNKILEFSKNGREEEITCISTRSKGDNADSMTDYFPNIWHNNLTQALKFIGAK